MSSDFRKKTKQESEQKQGSAYHVMTTGVLRP